MAGLEVTLHTVVAQLQERALGTQLSYHGQSMRMLPASSQTRRNVLAKSGDATQALSGELPFGDPGPENFALDTIAIFEYSIGFDAGKSKCRPRRVRCLQVLPVTRNELNEGIVAGTIWVSHT